MPTPFSHLAVAQRLLNDPAVSDDHRALLNRQRPAFLLGSIAADARVEAGTPRSATHFYHYVQEMDDIPPWRVMMAAHPSLWTPFDDAHAAFIAGYVAHLAMDEIWSRRMVAPCFVGGEWGDKHLRFVMLHIILIVMDERDEKSLETWQSEALVQGVPHEWLPFLPDPNLKNWRDLIYQQIIPNGRSQTLEIFGGRAGLTPAELRALLDSPELMHDSLWQYVPQAYLVEVEAAIYAHCVSQLTTYLDGPTDLP